MAITNGTTRGGDVLPRIYDRLRKRSQRARNWRAMGVSINGDDGFGWHVYDHAAYVAGVRDALNAVSETNDTP